MTTIIRYADIDLSGRGLPVLDIQADEITLGGLPYLSAWLDPGRRGVLPSPNVQDKKYGDIWVSAATAPSFIASHPVFNGRPGIDLTAGGSVGLVASRRPSSASYTIAMVMDLTSLVPVSAQQQLLRNRRADNQLNAAWLLYNRGFGFSPSWFTGGSASLVNWASPPMAVGAHIIAMTWDNVTKTAEYYVDSALPVYRATIAVGSENGPSSRWQLGASNAAPIVVGDLLIFDEALSKGPGLMDVLFTRLKARYGFA